MCFRSYRKGISKLSLMLTRLTSVAEGHASAGHKRTESAKVSSQSTGNLLTLYVSLSTLCRLSTKSFAILSPIRERSTSYTSTIPTLYEMKTFALLFALISISQAAAIPENGKLLYYDPVCLEELLVRGHKISLTRQGSVTHKKSFS